MDMGADGAAVAAVDDYRADGIGPEIDADGERWSHVRFWRAEGSRSMRGEGRAAPGDAITGRRTRSTLAPAGIGR
jgi:hypothetical protein